MPVVAYLDSNGRHDPNGRYELLLGIGALRQLRLQRAEGALARLQAELDAAPGHWWMGWLAYELKDGIEALQSRQPQPLALPLLHWFSPAIVLALRPDGSGFLHSPIHDEAALWQSLQQTPPWPAPAEAPPVPCLRPATPKAEYLAQVARLQAHIVEGDVYEVNYCQAFLAEGLAIPDVAHFFQRFNAIAQAPFAAYLRLGSQHLLSGSPERFLRREGQRLLSQPIKGTRPRHPDPAQDAAIRQALAESQKDRAENVMITDLVRNDLMRVCLPGSVAVEELFGLYAFPQVWQMISSVAGSLPPGLPWAEILRATFPMGSMTGAPKVMAMQLIERYEALQRGVYSGSVGYIEPGGDGDFSVVIRSMVYDAAGQRLGFHVGGAIVHDSTPEAEYAECLTKAKGILAALGLGTWVPG